MVTALSTICEGKQRNQNIYLNMAEKKYIYIKLLNVCLYSKHFGVKITGKLCNEFRICYLLPKKSIYKINNFSCFMDPKNFIHIGLLMSISYTTENLNVKSIEYENTGKFLNGNGKSHCGQSCKVTAIQSSDHTVGKVILIPLFDHHWYIPLHI